VDIGLWGRRAVLSGYRALLRVYWTLLRVHRALLSGYRAFVRVYRGVLSGNRYSSFGWDTGNVSNAAVPLFALFL